jgi:hypothetical protein
MSAPFAPKPVVAAHARALLSETPHEIDVELSHRLGSSVYVFPDGKALLMAAGGGVLFDARD